MRAKTVAPLQEPEQRIAQWKDSSEALTLMDPTGELLAALKPLKEVKAVVIGEGLVPRHSVYVLGLADTGEILGCHSVVVWS